MRSLWNLPGPDRFIRSVVDDLRDGASVVLRFGDDLPSGLDGGLERRCRWGFDWGVVRSGGQEPPLSLLRRTFCTKLRATDVRSALDLAHHPDFQHRLLWVDGVSPTTWPAWSAFLRSYSDASRNHVAAGHRSVFVLPLGGSHFHGAAVSGVAVRYREYRDVIHFHDLFVLALQRELDLGVVREHRALLANTVAHLAQWDYRLAERLLKAQPEAILQPLEILVDYAGHRGWTHNTPDCWELGTVDGPRDRPVVHSALLAVTGRNSEINRRLWAAQASVLLPLVEERRADFVNRYRDHFELPFQTELDLIESADDLELGHLVLYFERFRAPSPRAMREARRLRHLRNKLAHIEPLPPEQALHPMLLG